MEILAFAFGLALLVNESVLRHVYGEQLRIEFRKYQVKRVKLFKKNNKYISDLIFTTRSII